MPSSSFYMVKRNLQVKGIEQKKMFFSRHAQRTKDKAQGRRDISPVEGYTLAFDACSSRISFCLWEGDGVNLCQSSYDEESLAEDLPFLLACEIARVDGDFSYRSLRRICFVRGPGSYTGLRASLSVARGFRLACRGGGGGLELYSVTSFEAGFLSFGADFGGGYVLSLVESFRGVWYGQAFVRGNALGDARVLGDDALRLWVFELLEAGGGELGLCGGGVERACAEVLGSFPKEKLRIGGVGNACDFSRPLVRGDGGIYERGEGALQPIYMGKPV